MYTNLDEGKGTVRCYWKDIRDKVKKVESQFFDIVDTLDPDATLPVYLIYLPFGSLKGDHKSSFLPDMNGGFLRLTDSSLPHNLISELGYGKHSSPFGMVLEKELEYFIEIEDENLTIPSQIRKPGSFFNYSIILNKSNNRIYAPNGILKASSGCRSVFMLPNIGCMTHHINIQRDFNIQLPAPKKINDQWHVFKSLVNSKEIDCNWRTCIIYFSQSWINKLWNDISWLPLKLYLLEKERELSEHQRFNHYYDMIFSLIQKNKNLKPNPYLMDTVRHIFNITLGIYPGFIPANDENSLPVSLLQNIYINSYGLDKYTPTLMKPHTYEFETERYPIYYSLQQPTTHAFSPKSRNVSSALFDIRELMHIMNIFSKELSKQEGLCAGTILETIAKKSKFSYFHNKKDLHNVIKSSSDIIKEDPRFSFLNPPLELSESLFSSDAKFLRGCISIRPTP